MGTVGAAWVQRVLSEGEVRARHVQSWCGAVAGRARHRHEIMPFELEPREEVGDVVVLDEHVGVEEDGLLVRGAREQQRLLEPALIVAGHPVAWRMLCADGMCTAHGRSHEPGTYRPSRRLLRRSQACASR